MLQPEIVKYKPSFRAQLLAVWERSVLATHQFLSAEDYMAIRMNLQDCDLSTINIFCLMQEQQLLGFIAITDKKIDMLFLDANQIGKGFGKQLISFATNKFKVQEVDVNEQNKAALGFYQKMGFEAFERTPVDDFGMPYPLLRMRLKRSNF